MNQLTFQETPKWRQVSEKDLSQTTAPDNEHGSPQSGSKAATYQNMDLLNIEFILK